MLAAFIARLIIAAIDPLLQDWDERFHALVPKNMISQPFHPILLVLPIMPYKMEDWSCNQIWVRKQPLFLWQMTTTMKLFGTHLIALRLSSVIMGTHSIYFVYDLAKKWVNDIHVTYSTFDICRFLLST